jgi:hypothetical protein
MDRKTQPPAGPSGLRWRLECCRAWIEGHPRTGWYVAVLLFINYIFDLLAALKVF